MITVEKITEHDDGSCTIAFNVDNETLIQFAQIGLLKVLTDAASETVDIHSNQQLIPCNSPLPRHVCEGCDCWKSAREYSS